MQEEYVATREYAPLPLRLVLGFGLVYHGAPKLTPSGYEQFVGMLDGLGVPFSGFTAWAVGAFEVLGGLLLMIGLWIVLVSVIGVAHMLVAMFTVHISHGFSFLNIVGSTESGPVYGMPGYEVNLLYIAGFTALILLGSGRLSVRRFLDGLESKRSSGTAPGSVQTSDPERNLASVS